MFSNAAMGALLTSHTYVRSAGPRGGGGARPHFDRIRRMGQASFHPHVDHGPALCPDRAPISTFAHTDFIVPRLSIPIRPKVAAGTASGHPGPGLRPNRFALKISWPFCFLSSLLI